MVSLGLGSVLGWDPEGLVRCELSGRTWWARGEYKAHQDGRVVKALDLRSNGRMPAWVRTPLLVGASFSSASKVPSPAFGASLQSRDGISGPVPGELRPLHAPV